MALVSLTVDAEAAAIHEPSTTGSYRRADRLLASLPCRAFETTSAAIVRVILQVDTACTAIL